ncbi:nucleotidyltransferase domain-containing protein [Anaerocolumna sp. MB42-C2]|uniref:nucleotidyltransferase domain-containing protein n=1 Tax=Anaerocolumna sp. MB42-C2 TaxID=3070997 RepID=UPI0027E05A6E|nr:nucleotidyltransferase domain-containing protein [Anaerocolumna sp. MB42-C2]WMJ90286.1 nucleotidyltransferase domain-containing protein [Anaerocolumna sp. MB42-C2]
MEKLKIRNLLTEKNIMEIYLFGSVARGENDEYSDIDILIVIDDCEEKEYVNYKRMFAEKLKVPVEWISLYRLSKIERMFKNGSYFLWHIKKEGIKQYSRSGDLEKLLISLPKYDGVLNDLMEYKQIVNDIYNELSNSYININYELSVLASLVRNTCIAIAYLNNEIDFGRKSVIITCKKIYKEQITFTLDEYSKLYDYRLFQTGKKYNVDNGSKEMLEYWIKCENELLEIAMEGVEKNERKS